MALGIDKKWWNLLAMTCCIAMVFINQTVLPVALPTMQKELLLTSLAMQWAINAYLLALATFVLFGGYLGDILGHRKIFLIGVSIFAVSSLFCAFSWSAISLITGRSIQGVGAALMIPQTYPIIISIFEPKEKGKAIGFYAAFGSIFLTLGPVIGGVLTEYITWRLIFLINIPIALTAIILSLIFVPVFEGSKKRIDYIGFFILAISLVSIVLALMEGPIWGWGSKEIIFLFVAFLLSFFIFVIVEKKRAHPFVDLSIFKSKSLTSCFFVVFIVQFCFMVFIFWILFFQYGLKYTPMEAGLFTTVSTAPMLLLSPLGGHYADKFGFKKIIIIGVACTAITYLWMSIFTFAANKLWYIPGLLFFGVGLTFVFAQSVNYTMLSLPSSYRGIVTGILNTIRQVAATIGLAIIGGLFSFLNQEIFILESKKLNYNPKIVSFDNFNSFMTLSSEKLSKAYDISIQEVLLLKKGLFLSYELSFAWVNGFVFILTILALLVGLIFMKNKTYSKMPSTSE